MTHSILPRLAHGVAQFNWRRPAHSLVAGVVLGLTLSIILVACGGGGGGSTGNTSMNVETAQPNCTENPAAEGCTIVTETDCTTDPTATGCPPPVPSQPNCTANPTATGCPPPVTSPSPPATTNPPANPESVQTTREIHNEQATQRCTDNPSLYECFTDENDWVFYREIIDPTLCDDNRYECHYGLSLKTDDGEFIFYDLNGVPFYYILGNPNRPTPYDPDGTITTPPTLDLGEVYPPSRSGYYYLDDQRLVQAPHSTMDGNDENSNNPILVSITRITNDVPSNLCTNGNANNPTNQQHAIIAWRCFLIWVQGKNTMRTLRDENGVPWDLPPTYYPDRSIPHGAEHPPWAPPPYRVHTLDYTDQTMRHHQFERYRHIHERYRNIQTAYQFPEIRDDLYQEPTLPRSEYPDSFNPTEYPDATAAHRMHMLNAIPAYIAILQANDPNNQYITSWETLRDKMDDPTFDGGQIPDYTLYFISYNRHSTGPIDNLHLPIFSRDASLSEREAWLTYVSPHAHSENDPDDYVPNHSAAHFFAATTLQHRYTGLLWLTESEGFDERHFDATFFTDPETINRDSQSRHPAYVVRFLPYLDNDPAGESAPRFINPWAYPQTGSPFIDRDLAERTAEETVFITNSAAHAYMSGVGFRESDAYLAGTVYKTITEKNINFFNTYPHYKYINTDEEAYRISMIPLRDNYTDCIANPRYGIGSQNCQDILFAMQYNRRTVLTVLSADPDYMVNVDPTIARLLNIAADQYIAVNDVSTASYHDLLSGFEDLGHEYPDYDASFIQETIQSGIAPDPTHLVNLVESGEIHILSGRPEYTAYGYGEYWRRTHQARAEMVLHDIAPWVAVAPGPSTDEATAAAGGALLLTLGGLRAQGVTTEGADITPHTAYMRALWTANPRVFPVFAPWMAHNAHYERDTDVCTWEMMSTKFRAGDADWSDAEREACAINAFAGWGMLDVGAAIQPFGDLSAQTLNGQTIRPKDLYNPPTATGADGGLASAYNRIRQNANIGLTDEGNFTFPHALPAMAKPSTSTAVPTMPTANPTPDTPWAVHWQPAGAAHSLRARHTTGHVQLAMQSASWRLELAMPPGDQHAARDARLSHRRGNWNLGFGWHQEPDTFLGAQPAEGTHGLFGDWRTDTPYMRVERTTGNDVARWRHHFWAEVGAPADTRPGGLVTRFHGRRTVAYGWQATYRPHDGRRWEIGLHQPLRLEGGYAELTLPNGYTTDGEPVFTRRDFALRPTGREIQAHLRHTRQAGPAEWTLELQARRQPGHDADEPTDYRAGVEYRLPF